MQEGLGGRCLAGQQDKTQARMTSSPARTAGAASMSMRLRGTSQSTVTQALMAQAILGCATPAIQPSVRPVGSASACMHREACLGLGLLCMAQSDAAQSRKTVPKTSISSVMQIAHQLVPCLLPCLRAAAAGSDITGQSVKPCIPNNTPANLS